MVQFWRDTSLFKNILSIDYLLSSKQNATERKKHMQGRSPVASLILSIEKASDFLLEIYFYLSRYIKETIEQVIEYLATIRRAIIANLKQSLGNISLLDRVAKDKIIMRSISSQYDRLRDNTEIKYIVEIWEKRVEKTPEAIAVEDENEQITYRELNEKANRLAHQLKTLGIKPETIVGIYLEKSIARIASLIATLKAGGVYLPIDPAYPKERIQYIIEDSQPTTIITQNSLSSNLATENPPIINLDRDRQKIERQSSQNPVNTVTENNRAYIIYTSGSTGKPKGVEIEQKAIAKHSQTIIEKYQITKDDRILQFASVGFDVSLEQILPTLIAGATVVLNETKHLTGKEFHQKIQQLNLTIINLPPAYWSQWVQSIATNPAITAPPNLRLVICGGETMSPPSLKQWQKSPLQTIKLLNAYGPTETTITATTFEIPRNTKQTFEKIPIGKPLKNRQTYILDHHLQPVTTGESGELYLGGEGIARGYLHQPELTQAKFIDNPFGTGKLYRTGDIARYLESGDIEYLGRIDNQVKIRGFRLELGEIEAVIGQHPNIQAAVVILREDIQDDKYLVAYIVTITPERVKESIRPFLQQKLPDYMIPTAFVVMDELPLTPNGKIDRNSLPKPEIASNKRTIIAPRNPQEEILVNIWRKVLGIETIGIEDNFLELGGHSLLATQVISRIRETFKQEIPLPILFKNPTIAALAKKLTQTDQSNHSQHLALPSIPTRTESDQLPLSFPQERLWFLNRLEGNTATYNIATVLNLTGKLDIAALQQTITTIVERHEILRTNFTSNNGTPYQTINPNREIKLSSIDLQQLPETEKQTRIERIIRENTHHRFNLADESLLKLALIHQDTENHLLALTIHHIIADGWSMGIILQEISILYQAYSQRRTSPLEPLTIQYADFAIWQKRHFTQETLAPQLNYWRQQLAGLPPRLELPIDKPRPPIQTFAGHSLAFELPTQLTQQLKQLSQQSGVTLYMTLLAVLAVLLSRYSRQTDIAIGTAIANRNRQEIESLIGFFVNTLVLRFNLDDNPQFRDLLTQVRQVALEGYSHQDVPFEKIVEVLKPERSLSYHPLFQVMFVWQNTPQRDWELSELNITEERVSSETAKFDLTLSLEERGGKIEGFWEYNTDLWKTETIQRMMGHFQILLQGISNNCDRRVEELPLLTASERQQLLVEWNRTESDYPKEKCIHQLFEEQVVQTPDAVALVWGEKQFTYGELNEKANRLARYLQGLGVTAEVLVGVGVERSVEMIVSILAILKAGGAYLPLDVAYPSERLALMLDDARVSVLLTQQYLLGIFPTLPTHYICLDTDWLTIEGESPENLPNVSNGENLAYVMYTSGSTGIPKGVCIPHRAVVRLVKETNYASFSEDEVFLQLASTAFDASTWEIWGSLLNGAKLVLFPHNKPSLGELGRIIAQHQITILWLTAGLFHLMVDECLQDLKPVRQLLAGGDVLSVPHVQKVLANLEGCRLINGYGPTENTTFSCCHLIDKHDSVVNSISIGRPISNTQVYILDSYLQPLPIGVTGELYLGGDGLARGYLNRSDLTEEKFIGNPFGEGKLYRTGDLARYLGDGKIEFSGRIDNQIKIRGFRVELGEIEAAITQHSDIREAVVIVREDIKNDKRLVAYIVSVSEVKETISIRSFLLQKLPDYMIPAAFVVMDELPLTPNGKVDRRALPIPEISLNNRTIIAPSNYQEKIIANIWTEILGIRTVSSEDNFFELGGHSLLATQVISRIREAFNLEIPLRTLFESPTVAKLAEYLATLQINSNLRSILPVVRGQQLPLSFAQQRLWFLNRLEPDSNAYNMPYGFRLQGGLNLDAIQQSFYEVIHRHEILRTVFPNSEGEPSQVILSNFNLEIPIVDLREFPLQQREIEAQRIVREEKDYIFNLDRHPPIRIKILRLDDREYILLINMHHIIFDGWSSQILFAEISSFYQAFVGDKPINLPTIQLQYVDFAIWQRQWLSGDILDSQLSYWKQQLSGSLPAIELPCDRPHAPIQIQESAVHVYVFPSTLVEGLKTLSYREGVTLFMTLLAAFKLLLYRYSGQEDIIIGTPIAGRNRSEIEQLIGFFVNSLVLRTDLSGNPSFRELIKRVREVTLGAYANQDFPFEKLVEELKIERDLNRTPLFQIWFNMVNVEEGKLDLTDLKVESLPSIEISSKFDLTLYIRELDKEIQIQWVYNTALFNDDTIAGMVKHFERLLEEIVVTPDRSISNFSLLTEAERYQLSCRRNLIQPTNNFNEFSRSDIEQSIPKRFQQQVEKYGDRIAIKTKNYCWNYRDLERQVNRIAHKLIESIPNINMRIALLFEHDAPAIAAILAVLKTGNIYIPLDPNYPKERVDYILNNSRSSLILTNHKNCDRARELNNSKLPIIDIDDLEISETIPEINLEIAPDTIAYLLYTSGSTGQPKGVIQNHRNVLHFIRNYTNNLHIAPDDRLSLLASYSFDAAIIDIFSALLNGATLYPFDIKQEGLANLSQWLKDNNITIYHSTPTVYRYFLGDLDLTEKCNLDRIRLVVLGGEEVVKQDVELYRQYFANNCIFVNGLGCTESSFNLQYLVDKETVIPRNTVSVGYPFDETKILLLDAMGNPTDILGEIAIKSPYLALGYWDNSELTSKVFLDDRENTNLRIYRTGDWGRWRIDGSIEFLGRKDFQVKIRGFRIELGEIEASLNLYPKVKETVVIAKENSTGDKFLAAYIVPNDISISLEREDIRYFLQQRLPDYAIPTTVVFLEKLPLTPNGKINRLALPNPDNFRQDLEKTFVAPRDRLELQLAEIWEEVLAIQPIGIQDNFFDLGGNSLLAVKLLARLDCAFSSKIPLKALFQLSTIVKLANVIREKETSLTTSTNLENSLEIEAEYAINSTSEDNYPQLSIDENRWLLASTITKKRVLNESSLIMLERAGEPNSYRPLFFVSILGELGQFFDEKQPVYNLTTWTKVESPNTFIRALAARYVKEILAIQPSGSYLIGGYCFGGWVAFEISRQLQERGKKVDLLMLVQTPSSDPIYNRYQSLLLRCGYSLFLSLIGIVRDLGNLKASQRIKFLWQKIQELLDRNNRKLDREKSSIADYSELEILLSLRSARKSYIPQSYNGKVALFFAREGQLRSFLFPQGGLSKILTGKVSTYLIPGNHTSILRNPHVRILAEKIKTCLDSVNL